MSFSLTLAAASAVFILCTSFYFNIYVRDVTERELQHGRVPSPASNVSVAVERKNWGGIQAGFASSLRSFGRPLVLQNTVAANYSRFTLADISKMQAPDSQLSSVFMSDSPVFGPYYDPTRPFHHLQSVRGKAPYMTDFHLPIRDLESAFSSHGPPFYHLSATPEELGMPMFNIKELISLYPQRSSVNVWVGMKGGTTPCHYDGYHNMYVQLSGQKKFILLPPDRMSSLGVYPFLHPSYGQCGASLEDLDWRRRDWMEVTLRPGELLYIPPFWLHEVIGVTPSVAFNVWTGTEDEDIFQQILSMPIPGLEHAYDSSGDAQTDQDPALLPFRPHFPLLTKEFNILQTRIVLGSFLVLEVLHRVDVKDLLVSSMSEVRGRYKPLLDTTVLEGIPPVVENSLSRTIDQWLPKPPAFAPAIWGMSVADKQVGISLAVYTRDVSDLIRKLSPDTRQVWGANFIEAVALQVGGIEKASWMIDIIRKKYEREEARKRT